LPRIHTDKREVRHNGGKHLPLAAGKVPLTAGWADVYRRVGAPFATITA
jgi:hypothetical protein